NRAASVQLKTACSKSPRWNELKPCSICRAAGEASGAAAADAGFAVETKGLPIKLSKTPSTSVRLYLKPGRRGRLILGSSPKTRGGIHVPCPVRGLRCNAVSFFTNRWRLDHLVPFKDLTIIYFPKSALSNSEPE